MQPKGGPGQGSNLNSDLATNMAASNAVSTAAGVTEQVANISATDMAVDKVPLVNQALAARASGVGSGQHQSHHQQHHHHHHHQQHHHHQSDPTAEAANLAAVNQHQHDTLGYVGVGNNNYQSQHQAPYHRNRNHPQHKNENESPINHVILITVINPHYPITCELIHQICTNYGKVNRIVIFKKNGVQAMVEFDGIEAAKRAKTMLQGCDIYSGCCTLRVEYAKPARLNVHKNTSDSFDYTNLDLGSTPGIGHQVGGEHHVNTYLHNHSRNVGANQGGRPRDNNLSKPNIPPATTAAATAASHIRSSMDQDPSAGPDYVAVGEFLSTSQCANPHYNQHHHHHHQHNQLGGPPPHPHNQHARDALMSASGPQGTVMMVYGLNADKINCDRLFNLFCLYGNVVRIKFLRTKEGCAMVQMGDMIAVDRCVSSLNKITLFGNELQISYSKQAFLHDVIQPFTLPDGTVSFKDFMGNKNNRFKNPEVASKNRILPPSKVLHFFSAPYGISEDELVHLFKQTTDYEPMSIKIFPPKAENVKSYSGLVTFRDPAEATEALVLCNHISMPKAGAPHPYILRLCFSPPTYSGAN